MRLPPLPQRTRRLIEVWFFFIEHIGAATLKQIINNRQKTVDKTLDSLGLARGGIALQSDPVHYDRGWYKCGKCGQLFEDHIPMRNGKLLRNAKCIFCGNE